MKRLAFPPENRILLTDGAMGTMLEQAGFSLRDNTALLSVTAPEAVEKIHAAYFEAGSDIVFTNTFSASPLKLEGSGHTTEEVVVAAVGCAKRATPQKGGLIGLDIGPLGKMISPLGPLSFDEAVTLFSQQISAGVTAGVDLIAIETMMDLQEAKAALRAAKNLCCLPVMVTMTFEANGRTFTGCDAVNMVLTLEAAGADVIGINCSVGPVQMKKVVDTIAQWTSLPIAVKPNAGLPDENGRYTLKVTDFAEGIGRLIDSGAAVVGGCCGTNPDFIAVLSKSLNGAQIVRRNIDPPVALCSGTRFVMFDKPVLAGSRLLKPDDSLTNAWAGKDYEALADEAAQQQDDGAGLIAVGVPVGTSAKTAQGAIEAISAICPLPMIVSADDPAVADAALRAARGKSALLIKSPASRDALLESAINNGSMVISAASPTDASQPCSPENLCLFSPKQKADSRCIPVFTVLAKDTRECLNAALSHSTALILADPAHPAVCAAMDEGFFD